MDKCIPANPDISGIGVRAAIYAQNLLCFAPVVAHLWDGHISTEELAGVKDQSIGMLAIAFAILISTIIGATNVRSGQIVTNFHAAVILDLSWMNNTSTWIWFLLYAHHLTKPAADTEPKRSREPLAASWSAWTSTLLSPVRHLVMDRGESNPDGASNVEEGTASRGGKKVQKKVPVVRRAWNFVSKAPVLTLGSIHLSLMGAIGLWLWSNPSKFGTPISNCDPSLTVIGGAVPFSSLGLRIFSLAIYCLLIIPGLNLVLPFLFFLALHITYNKSRKRHSHFWEQVDHLIDSIHIYQDFYGTVQHGASALHSLPRSIRALFRRQHTLSPDLELRTLGSDPSSGHSTPVEPVPPRNNHTAFLIVGLVSLGVINIILLVDIELTLRRNKRDQSPEEDQWGFGQILALLLLVVPLRDFVTSILDIREKVKREKEVKEKVQKDFEEHLQQAVSNDTFEGHDFKALIQGGADANVVIEGGGQLVTLLQFAALQGNEGLIRFLLDRGIEDTEGKAFYTAARHNRFGSACLLGKGRTKEERAETAKKAICQVVESLEDSYSYGRQAALGCLSGLGAHDAFQEEIRTAIPMVAESLKDSDSDVRHAALECLSGLAAHSAFQEEIQTAIFMVAQSLKDSDSDVRQAALGCLSGLGAHAAFQEEIQPAIFMVAESLKDSSWQVRQAALECLSGLAAHSAFQEEIRTAILMVAELLKDSNSDVRHAALGCLSGVAAHPTFQMEIQTAMLMVAESLKDSDSDVRQAALGCLSGLGAHAAFQEEIQTAMLMVAESLKDSDSDVRQAALGCLSGLGAHAAFQEQIQTAIFMVAESLKDSSWQVRQAALGCLSGLGAHAAFQEEIRTAIPMVVESLKDSDPDVRHAALGCLSGLAAHAAFQEEIQPAILMVAELLKDSNSDVRDAALGCLSGLAAHSTFQEEIRTAILMVVKSLKDSGWHVRHAALECLSGLAAHSAFQEEIRTAIPMVVESLKDSDPDVRHAALGCLSGLAAHAAFQEEIQPAILMVAELLKDSNSDVRDAALGCLSGLAAHSAFQEEIRTAIPMVAESLKDSESHVRQAARGCLSRLGAHAAFQEIQPAILMVAELLKDSDSDVRHAALECLSGLAAHSAFQEEIQTAMLMVAESLKDSDSDVRQAALGCLSGLGAHGIHPLGNSEPFMADRSWFLAAFQEEIQPAILMVAELLKDSDSDVRHAALGCLSGLAAHSALQEEIQTAIFTVAESLKDSNWQVRQAALGCLSGLGAHAAFQEEIQTAIPMVAQSLKDSDWRVRQAALGCLSSLGVHAAFQEQIQTAIPMVVESLKDSNSHVWKAVLECFSGLRAQDCEIILLTILSWGIVARESTLETVSSLVQRVVVGQHVLRWETLLVPYRHHGRISHTPILSVEYKYWAESAPIIILFSSSTLNIQYLSQTGTGRRECTSSGSSPAGSRAVIVMPHDASTSHTRETPHNSLLQHLDSSHQWPIPGAYTASSNTKPASDAMMSHSPVFVPNMSTTFAAVSSTPRHGQVTRDTSSHRPM
ncbi:armadillo-type protein [Mycena amicta]|nr:armadillo-type protein [Mycena amicta]